MTKPNSQNPILDKPVYVSTRRKINSDLSQTIGNEEDTIVASIKYGNRTYEISIRVKQDGKNSSLVTLANNTLAQKVEALAAGLFGHLPPIDGQEISAHRDGSITVNNEKLDSQDNQEVIDAANTFKKAVAGDLNASGTLEAFSLEEEAIHSFERTYEAKSQKYLVRAIDDQFQELSQSNPVFDDNNDAMAGRAVITPLSDRLFTSDNNDFKIFTIPQEKKAHSEKEIGAVLTERKASKKETAKTLDGLRLSQIPRQDQQLSIENTGNGIQAIAGPETLTTYHRLFYNSSENHKGYIAQNGKCFYTEHAVPSSSNRVSDVPTMGRAILDKNGASIAYTGQFTTEEMALIAIRNMIKTEWAAKDKSKLQPQDSKDEFKLPFLVNGLLTTSIFHSLRGLDYETPMVEAEAEALKNLSRQTIEVKVAEGRTIKVKILPFFVNTSLNDCVHPIQAWSDGLSGLAKTRKLSKTGDDRFKAYVRAEMDKLQKTKCDDPDYDKNQQKARRLKEALAALSTPDPDASLDSINKLIDRAVICELLEIPFYVHCKSSIDRTSFAISIACAVHQIIKSAHLTVFEEKGISTPHVIMQNRHAEAFKDLVILNASVGSVFVEMSRGKPGFQWSAIIPEYFRTAKNSDLIDSLRKKSGPMKKILQRLIRKKLKILRAQHAAYIANLQDREIETIEPANEEEVKVKTEVKSKKIPTPVNLKMIPRQYIAQYFHNHTTDYSSFFIDFCQAAKDALKTKKIPLENQIKDLLENQIHFHLHQLIDIAYTIIESNFKNFLSFSQDLELSSIPSAIKEKLIEDIKQQLSLNQLSEDQEKSIQLMADTFLSQTLKLLATHRTQLRHAIQSNIEKAAATKIQAFARGRLARKTAKEAQTVQARTDLPADSPDAPPIDPASIKAIIE